MADGILPVPPPVISRVFQAQVKKRHLRTRHCSLHTSAYCIQKWLCEARRERLQEMSRGIVNLQNARKIADFPFPFPYHQAGSLVVNACKGQLW